MTSGAAFVDLDRTLVRGASGPAFSQAMREALVNAVRPLTAAYHSRLAAVARRSSRRSSTS